MALFLKQDFSPPLLSKRWMAMKFRPNMLLYARDHVISILESGLLFREDSTEVETLAPSPEDVWKMAGGGGSGWLTGGERVMGVVGVCGCLVVCPPRSLSRTSIALCVTYTTLPIAIRTIHRALCRATYLRDLLAIMRDYLALARRAAACVKEYGAMFKEIESISSSTESCRTLLTRQQCELSLLMSRASSALLGNVPWLRGDVAWEAVVKADEDNNLMKIHHAFLVIQSTLLKHVAMAHFLPSAHAQKIYKNHNERLYWIHTVLLQELYDEFKQNYDILERNYRLLKNYSNKRDEPKILGAAITDSWVYSEVHSGIARGNIELKMALNKCNSLDIFLDACAMNKQQINTDILNKDLDDLIDGLTKCLNTIQASQFRLKKLKNKFGTQNKMVETEKQNGDVEDKVMDIISLDAIEPQSKDEVFYFVKTEDDEQITEPAKDVTSAPGKKEKETTKIVINELKRKLVKREDLMRERERQALVNTMPEFKNNIPEFPRQIDLDENCDKKGYITKIKHRKKEKEKLFRNYKIQSKIKSKPFKSVRLKSHFEPSCECLDANINIKEKNTKKIQLWLNNDKLLCVNNRVYPKKDDDEMKIIEADFSLSDHSDGEGDVPKIKHQTKNYEIKFTKKDLELSTSSDTDLELHRSELLKDIRRHRVVRKKKFPANVRTASEDQDEGSKPMEYSFSAGMAMASFLKGENKINLGSEEVFIGNGEVSDDSGNDEDV